jgi:hypothetical protein
MGRGKPPAPPLPITERQHFLLKQELGKRTTLRQYSDRIPILLGGTSVSMLRNPECFPSLWGSVSARMAENSERKYPGLFAGFRGGSMLRIIQAMAHIILFICLSILFSSSSNCPPGLA